MVGQQREGARPSLGLTSPTGPTIANDQRATPQSTEAPPAQFLSGFLLGMSERAADQTQDILVSLLCTYLLTTLTSTGICAFTLFRQIVLPFSGKIRKPSLIHVSHSRTTKEEMLCNFPLSLNITYGLGSFFCIYLACIKSSHNG